MTEPVFGVDAATTNAGLDQWAADIQAKAERYSAMEREVTAVTATESSSDGSIRVTVDSAGAIKDLQFTEDLKRLPATRMAELVLTTMRKAQARISDQVAEIVQTRVGDDPETTEAVVGAYRARFPDPEPEQDEADGTMRLGQVDEDDQPGERPRPPRRPRPEDDDDFGGSIFH
ncbi:YbaB/EbfC DNA-binding family protein [Actinokineospora alba]|uniref:YbaB/EbfC DNA-binding family protein n=1 Tax=Actinokineospora alba TaxID=504798 RepID=A0A1H0KFN8_9PSEU|nr:YbaB/EbfC family nucleoid-associated protein [Actinokineospora alba]TDP67924.1 YbaB/EbfC DNA-binding family protein [Actinokineospora alba]SDH88917.1 YbaB/EbfC DNA-binding family protein [Actinokineospora alba]SDO54623.1 YbaB/EbfC DNA-binding family protein [Actinokineospora alba]